MTFCCPPPTPLNPISKLMSGSFVRVVVEIAGVPTWKEARVHRVEKAPKGGPRTVVPYVDLAFGSGRFLLWLSVSGVCGLICAVFCPAQVDDMGNPHLSFPGKSSVPRVEYLAESACTCGSPVPC